MMNIHTTCIAFNGRGVLIFGAPGSGNSDLALRCIANKNAILVADDRTNIDIREGRIIASCPANIKGMLEVRGVGIHKMHSLEFCEIKLAVELVKSYKDMERLPEPAFYEIGGIKIPLLKLYPFEASAPDKLVIKLDSAID